MKIIFTLLILLNFIQFSLSCKCFTGTTIAQDFSEADLVLSGKVTKIQVEGFNKFVTLDVIQIWKKLNDDVKQITVSTCTESACCGFDFEDGKEYLVYIYNKTKVSLCSKTRLLELATDQIPELNALSQEQ
jgi:hypothetical protein